MIQLIVSEFKLKLFYYVHFRINTLGMDMNPFIPQLWAKLYHYCPSRRMHLALNNLLNVDMPLNKETKPNQLGQDTTQGQFANGPGD